MSVEGNIKEEGGNIVTDNVQAGLNHALKELLNDEGDGVKEIVVPSGFAIISVATKEYNTYKNRNATLLSKKQAYSFSMAAAQKQMVANFEGLMSACNKAFSTEMQTIDTGSDEGQANTSTSGSESCKEQVEGTLAGYVTYFVKDNPQNKEVVVALASSTKTHTAIKKIGGAMIQTHDMKKAWSSLMTEITRGLVPPLGARLLINPTTGESVVIGFGSSIVRKNRDKSIERKLKKSAKRQAQMRANNALVGFLNGDKVYWEGGFDEKQMEESKQFKLPPPPDPKEAAATPQQQAENIKVFNETQGSFLNMMKESDAYSIVTKGRLPPGVKPKSFFDENGDWAIAIAVYSSSMTARAEKAGARNREAGGKLDVYQKERDRNQKGSGGNNHSSRPLRAKGGLVEDIENHKGPSGHVTRDSDL